MALTRCCRALRSRPGRPASDSPAEAALCLGRLDRMGLDLTRADCSAVAEVQSKGQWGHAYLDAGQIGTTAAAHPVQKTAASASPTSSQPGKESRRGFRPASESGVAGDYAMFAGVPERRLGMPAICVGHRYSLGTDQFGLSSQRIVTSENSAPDRAIVLPGAAGPARRGAAPDRRRKWCSARAWDVRPDANSTGLPGPAPAGVRLADSGTRIMHEIIPDYAQGPAGIP